MENSNEFYPILFLIISGILFSVCLIKSARAKNKLPRVWYLITATICLNILIEASLRLTSNQMPGNSLQNIPLIIRVMQGLLIFLGILITIKLKLKKRV